MAGDSAYQCGKEQRRDDRTDEAQKNLAEDAQLDGRLRVFVGEQELS